MFKVLRSDNITSHSSIKKTISFLLALPQTPRRVRLRQTVLRAGASSRCFLTDCAMCQKSVCSKRLSSMSQSKISLSCVFSGASAVPEAWFCQDTPFLTDSGRGLERVHQLGWTSASRKDTVRKKF